MSDSLRQLSKDTLKGSLLSKIVTDLREKETAVVFPDAALAPAAGLTEVEIDIEVHDGDGDVVSVSDETTPTKEGIREVQVDITGGTQAGTAQLTGQGDQGAVGASVIVRLENGRGKVKLNVGGTGTVDLGLTDSQGHGLTVTDTLTVTFS